MRNLIALLCIFPILGCTTLPAPSHPPIKPKTPQKDIITSTKYYDWVLVYNGQSQVSPKLSLQFVVGEFVCRLDEVKKARVKVELTPMRYLSCSNGITKIVMEANCTNKVKDINKIWLYDAYHGNKIAYLSLSCRQRSEPTHGGSPDETHTKST